MTNKFEVWYDYENHRWFIYVCDWDMDRVLFSFDEYDEAYLESLKIFGGNHNE